MGRDQGAGTIPCVGEESEMLEASVGWGGGSAIFWVTSPVTRLSPKTSGLLSASLFIGMLVLTHG